VERMAAEERRALLVEAIDTLLLLLAPFAPHLVEELWAQGGHHESVFGASWPTPDPAALEREAVQIVVQVDGRVRSRLAVPPDTAAAALEAQALADAKVRPWVEARAVERVVVVPGRLVNIVTRAS
jgi:leucyl-tRNA synthetase